MTTQTVQIHTYDYGASLSSATLRSIENDALVATADSVNEVTADSGLYAAVFGEASVIAAGTYRVRAIVGGQPINRYVTLAGTDNEVAQARSERLAVLDPTALDPVLEAIAALESASATWTDAEKAQIRYRLGLEGTATAPPEPDVDPIVITPATGIMTTGYLVTRVKGVPTAGITIRYQQAQEPAADRGSSYDDTVYSAVSNSEGIAELSLVKGGLYYVWRSSASRPMNVAAYRVLKADGTTPDATLALPSHVGA